MARSEALATPVVVRDHVSILGDARYSAPAEDPRFPDRRRPLHRQHRCGWCCARRLRDLHRRTRRLAGIDTAEARSMPGVVGVYTAADVSLPVKRVDMARVPEAMVLPLLATDTVRFVGELVAAVIDRGAHRCGRRRRGGRRRLRTATPAVVGVDEALRERLAAALPRGWHERRTAAPAPFRGGDQIFDGCEVVVRERLVNQRVAVAPMETARRGGVVGRRPATAPVCVHPGRPRHAQQPRQDLRPRTRPSACDRA